MQKSWFLLFLFLSSEVFASMCPDLSGSYLGSCEQTVRTPSLHNKFRMNVTIQQRQCHDIKITTHAYPDFPDTKMRIERFYPTKGLEEVSTGHSVKTFHSAAFHKDVLATTVLYELYKKPVTISTKFTQYRKESRDGHEYLVVSETMSGSLMTCKLLAD